MNTYNLSSIAYQQMIINAVDNIEQKYNDLCALHINLEKTNKSLEIMLKKWNMINKY